MVWVISKYLMSIITVTKEYVMGNELMMIVDVV